MKKQLSLPARVGKEIKKVLKEKYPTVKFSVRSRRFLGGNEVFVKWMDGPTKSNVEKLIGKYKFGHFDGMTDSYIADNCREDIEQVKYLLLQRSISIKAINDIKSETEKRYGVCFTNAKEVKEKTGRCPWDIISIEFENRDYTKEAEDEDNK